MTSETPGNDTRAQRPRRSSGTAGDGSPTELQDAYLRRSIAEIESLNREILACTHCAPKDELPVLASGSPQAVRTVIKRNEVIVKRLTN